MVQWFEALVDQPSEDPERRQSNTAWDAGRLEHRFSVHLDGTGGEPERVLTAPEYPGGTLDWHAFSVAAAAGDGEAPEVVTEAAPRLVNRTVFPAPVRFSGMPPPRWWAVEDGRINFAAVRPDSTDLARRIFLEFALVYSNDWFTLPCDLPAGTLGSPTWSGSSSGSSRPARAGTAVLRQRGGGPAGRTKVALTYNRTRRHDGRVALWLSVRTHAGRGEGSSGLTFDYLADTRPPGGPAPGLPGGA
ncbi:hypothetical protein [Streptomyces sp. NPDC006463]|uniref:hypothetical protein n=1 Tax=Streptomyces sp. NPDC006463 TaxID=3364746 RepID=UPI0036A3826B